MALLESGEMYLENILILSNELPAVRSIDVADRMGFSKPSVSRAVKILKENGYIDVDAAGAITLTANGREIAERLPRGEYAEFPGGHLLTAEFEEDYIRRVRAFLEI